MLNDVVVDTNIFMHAGDGRDATLQTSAIDFIEKLISASTLLCVDEGYSINEAENTSYIWSEYLRQIQESTVGRSAIAFLAQSGRLSEVSRDVPEQVARVIRRVVRDRTDRVFVQVAMNSNERVLVSHDERAFSELRERAIRDRLHVRLVDAEAAIDLL